MLRLVYSGWCSVCCDLCTVVGVVCVVTCVVGVVCVVTWVWLVCYLLLAVQYVLKPVFTEDQIGRMDRSSKWAVALDGEKYLPGA